MKRKILLGALFCGLFANSFATPLMQCSAGEGAQGTGAIRALMVQHAECTLSGAPILLS